MLDSSLTEQLSQALRGQLVQPGDANYDEARAVWNGMIDRRPTMIVRCTGTVDVISAVNFARQHDLPVSVRAGGHNVAGKAVCDDGVMIDLSAMNAVRVDPHAQIARVEGGATWADFDREAQKFGLATTGGVDSRTGVAGLTLGGGNGYLARSYGLSVDNLVAADVVTAGGETVHASETEHPDLFWALRGGGGSFGVVTSFEFQLHKVGPEVLTAQIFYPFEAAKETLRFYRDFMATAPDEVACLAAIVHVPPVPPFPEEFHGKMAVALIACYSGAIDENQAVLKPFQDFGDPILKAIQPMPYATLQQSLDAGTPDGERYYYKSQFLGGLSDDAINTIANYMEPLPGPFSIIGIEPMGGAINRIDATATAFPHRNAAYNFGIWAGWTDPSDDGKIIAWAREFHQAMEPHATGGMYANYLSQDDATRVRAAYGENYERMQNVKARYDPNNMFRVNQNVAPKT